MAWAEMARVLVIERGDDPRVARLLDAEGFGVVTAPTLLEALESIAGFRPGGVIIEVDWVNESVQHLCVGVRASTAAPLAILSAHADESDVVSSFGAGADAFIAQSVGRHELVARVRALLRRAPVIEDSPPEHIVVGPIVLDRARREVFVNDQQISLPRREFDIAEVLMRKAGRVVPRTELIRELWGTARDTKSLDVQVGRLRSKLTAAEGRQRIMTVRGVGFRFLTDAESDAAVDLSQLETPVTADVDGGHR